MPRTLALLGARVLGLLTIPESRHCSRRRFGTLKAVGPVAYFSKTGSVLQGPAPEEPGQHTQAILANAGFTSEEIAQLCANQVVS